MNARILVISGAVFAMLALSGCQSRLRTSTDPNVMPSSPCACAEIPIENRSADDWRKVLGG